MDLNQLAQISKGRLIGESINFEGFSIDSRTIGPGELYISLLGKNFDGHEFLAEAKGKGASAAVVSQSTQIDFPQILVDDTFDFMRSVAAYNRNEFKGKVIGITGTNGKTSTKQIIFSLLNKYNNCHRTLGNMNNQIGVPFSLLSLQNNYQYSVIEMGTSEPGEIEILTRQVNPDIAAITNVSIGHLEGLTDTDSIALEKGNILDFQTNNGIAFLPKDSNFYQSWKHRTNAKEVLSFGFDKESDFRISGIKSDLENNLTSFNLYFDGSKEELLINGIGFHNALNAALSFGVAFHCGIGLSQIKENLKAVDLPQRRLSVFKSISDSILIDDSYNSNPASLKNALDSLEEMKGKKICVLGEMKELGEGSAEIHKEMYHYAKDKTDKILLLGDVWSSIDLDETDSLIIFDNHDEIYDYLVSVLDHNTILLVKGSRSTRMDLIADKLKN